MGPYFLGINIAAQGACVVLLDANGVIIGQNERTFILNSGSKEEQSPELWWESCMLLIRDLIQQVKGKINPEAIQAISVTSTSGTIIPLDKDNSPLHNAIMWSDKRSAKQALKCVEAASRYHKEGFMAFDSSAGLPKMVWFAETYPESLKYLHRWVHAADYITGKLSNCWGVTDYTNAFKSGYDFGNLEWPFYIYDKLHVKRSWLPRVVTSGTVIGKIDPLLAVELGLPLHIAVTAGVTDDCALQIASGAVEPGMWNTTIGSTMIIKGVTRKEICDPDLQLYSYKHPEGYWMPGCSGNTGVSWSAGEFGLDIDQLNNSAEMLIPTNFISYPLRQAGAFFPMIEPCATGFEPEGLSNNEKFTASMEGVAYLERYALELISQLSGETVKAIYTAGGANSTVWLTIRSSVLNVPVYQMKHVSAVMGAAILAASNTWFKSLKDAVKALTTLDKAAHPRHELSKTYEENYQEFLFVMTEKRYIKERTAHV